MTIVEVGTNLCVGYVAVDINMSSFLSSALIGVPKYYMVDFMNIHELRVEIMRFFIDPIWTLQ